MRYLAPLSRDITELGRFQLVVVGSSAGGVSALKKLLSLLPPDLPLPIAIAHHCHSTAPSVLPGILNRHSHLPVKQAEDGERLHCGQVYVAAPGRHFTVTVRGHAALSHGPKIRYSRPSVDALFASAAATYRDKVLGIVLTGSNGDGAAGAGLIHSLGGIVIAQQSPEFRHMPEATIAAGCVHFVLPLEKIASAIIALCMLPGAAEWMQRPAKIA